MNSTFNLRSHALLTFFCVGVCAGSSAVMIADVLDARHVEPIHRDEEVNSGEPVRLEFTPTGSLADTTEINMNAALHAYSDAVSTPCEHSAVYTWAIQAGEAKRVHFAQYAMTCSADGHWHTVRNITPLETR